MTLPESYAAVLGRFTRLLALQRAHLLTRPEAYAGGVGLDLFQEVAESTAWLLTTPPPEPAASPTPRESTL